MNKSTYKPQAVYRPLAPRPIGTMRQNYLRRTVKAVYLFATTRYSWHLSWVQANNR